VVLVLWQYLGRNVDVFKVNGQWVSPLYIEDIILRHEGVKEVSVIGHTNEESGLTEVVAFVVANQIANTDECDMNFEMSLLTFCIDQHIPSFQIPTVFCFVKDIKKNATGKIIRSVLREEYAKQIMNSPTKQSTPMKKQKSNAQTRKEIIALFNQYINADVEDHGKHTLMALGVDSSMLTRLRNMITSRYTDISYKVLYNETIDEVLEQITAPGTTTKNTPREAVNWEQECRLPAAICQQIQAQAASPSLRDKQQSRGTLLTGATGFLGMHILQEQLEAPNAADVIYVVVRGENQADSTKKLLRAAAQYDMLRTVQEGCDCGRVEVICADLEQASLGLPASQLSFLAETVDVIIHNGAAVNWLLDYWSLRQVNVGGTVELLRLCTSGVKKRFVYVGSIGAFLPGEGRQESGELQGGPAAVMDSMNGYGASKRVSEILVGEAIALGLDGYICRPGTIAGSFRTGCCNPADTLNRFLLSVCQLGVAPRLPHGGVSLLPVEAVAAVISGMSLFDPRGEAGLDSDCGADPPPEECERRVRVPRRCTIVGESVPMDDIVGACADVSGRHIRELSLPDFTATVVASESALFPVASFFADEKYLPLGDETITYGRENYITVTKELAVASTDINNRCLITKYLKNLLHTTI
jgi:thioester reductase-like protein